MLGHEVLFGELRSVLQRRPSEHVWGVLCEHVERWEDEAFEEVALPYALAHLERWPYALREAPQRWVSALASGEREARAALCASVVATPARGGVRREEELATLCAVPELEGLRALDIGGWRLGPSRFERLVEGLSARGLEVLEIGECQSGPRGAAALAGSPKMAALRELYMFDNGVGEEGATLLARSSWLVRLEALNLRKNGVGDGGVEALGCAAFVGLRELFLNANNVGDVGFESLCAGALQGLEVLAIGANHISAAGLRALLAPGRLPALRELDLSVNAISGAVVHQLARWPEAARLEVLRLEHNPLTEADQRALASSPHLAMSIRAAWGAQVPHAAQIMDLEALRDQLDMSLEQRFEAREEELPALLWDEIMRQRELWPAASWARLAAPRIEAATASWPERVKELPFDALIALMEGREAPHARLCRCVVFNGWGGSREELIGVLSAPELGQIRCVMIYEDAAQVLDALVTAPLAGAITTLHILEGGDEAAAIIARSPALSALRELYFGRDGISGESLAVLGEAAHLGSLERLLISNGYEQREALSRLRASPHLSEALRAELDERVAYYHSLSVDDDIPF